MSTTDTQNIASILRAHHSTLIQGLKRKHEARTGKTLHPFEWFQLLTQGPEYQWMKPMIEIMSDIDALNDQGSISSNDLAVVRHALDKLFDMDESPEDFKNKYLDAIAANSDLILSHAALKKAIDGLPRAAFEGDAASIRRSWHERRPRRSH
jgi:hypothetical protein